MLGIVRILFAIARRLSRKYVRLNVDDILSGKVVADKPARFNTEGVIIPSDK